MTTTPMPELPPLPAVSFLGDDISYGYDREDMHDYAKAYARAAIEAATEQGKPQWLPIADAPRDGTKILLYRPNSIYSWARVVGGYFDVEKYSSKPRPYWTHDCEKLCGMLDTRKNEPTHWQPLPLPPTATPQGNL